jgi:multisubunit Na+/H+ antiporter MnhF subunit
MLKTAAVIGIVWIEILLAVLAISAARAGAVLSRVLWLDTLGLALMALLTLVAYARSSAAYLDAALALGLLAFAGTLAAAHFHHEGRLL